MPQACHVPHIVCRVHTSPSLMALPSTMPSASAVSDAQVTNGCHIIRPGRKPNCFLSELAGKTLSAGACSTLRSWCIVRSRATPKNRLPFQQGLHRYIQHPAGPPNGPPSGTARKDRRRGPALLFSGGSGDRAESLRTKQQIEHHVVGESSAVKLRTAKPFAQRLRELCRPPTRADSLYRHMILRLALFTALLNIAWLR
jgi:hypothetical protein